MKRKAMSQKSPEQDWGEWDERFRRLRAAVDSRREESTPKARSESP